MDFILKMRDFDRILHEITKRWGKDATRWVVELCFEDLFVWNTWMWTQRREKPLGMLSWGSDPYPYAPDGTKGADTGGGRGAATLESGLDNGPMYDVPFNKTGLFVQDEYDAGYTGMFLMDCQAQIVLAKMIGRDSAASVLQARFDTVNTAMKEHLWSEAEGYYMNRLSDESLTPVQKMAPTSFYPLLVGPADGPSEAQAVTMVQRHLTNNSRFAVWKNATPPTDHIVPPMGGKYTSNPTTTYRLDMSDHMLLCFQHFHWSSTIAAIETTGTSPVRPWTLPPHSPTVCVCRGAATSIRPANLLEATSGDSIPRFVSRAWL